MKYNRRIFGIYFQVICLAIFLPSMAVAQLDFKGNLLDRPCRVAPTSLTLEVDFRETATLLYQNWPGKSYEESFSIKLINCHATAMNKVVKLTFYGVEEKNLPGYLQVTGNNAGLLGIGIIDIDGSSLLKIGQAHNRGQGKKVDANSLELNFKAYVQATADALTNKSVQAGNYSAVATFELNYQ